MDFVCHRRCFVALPASLASLLCFVALLASLASLLCWLRCFASLLCWLRCFVCCFACFASCFSLKNAPTPKHTCQKPQVHTTILQLNDLKATERFMCHNTAILYAHRSSTAEHFEDTTNTLTHNHIDKETPKTTRRHKTFFS